MDSRRNDIQYFLAKKPTRVRQQRQRAEKIKAFVCTSCKSDNCAGCVDRIRASAIGRYCSDLDQRLAEPMCHCKRKDHRESPVGTVDQAEDSEAVPAAVGQP